MNKKAMRCAVKHSRVKIRLHFFAHERSTYAVRMDVEKLCIVYAVLAAARRCLRDADEHAFLRQGFDLSEHDREASSGLFDGRAAAYHTTIPPIAYTRAKVTNCCPKAVSLYAPQPAKSS